MRFTSAPGFVGMYKRSVSAHGAAKSNNDHELEQVKDDENVIESE